MNKIENLVSILSIILLTWIGLSGIDVWCNQFADGIYSAWNLFEILF